MNKYKGNCGIVVRRHCLGLPSYGKSAGTARRLPRREHSPIAASTSRFSSRGRCGSHGWMLAGSGRLGGTITQILGHPQITLALGAYSPANDATFDEEAGALAPALEGAS